MEALDPLAHRLYHRLASDWQSWQLGGGASQGDRLAQLLIAAYTQPQRHYHNLHHIQHLLTIVDRFAATLIDPVSIYLAVWFHDFVYDPQRSDNELQSAARARELLANIGSAQLIDRVSKLILATQAHQVAPEEPDRSIFLDADLAILGAAPRRYLAYARSIRQEYSWVGDTDYQRGRIRVLERFLERDRLFYTEPLFRQLEALARSNMHDEIIALTTDRLY